MRSRYLNFSFFAPKFINRVVLIIIAVIISLLLWKKSKAQIIELERIKEKKQLVGQIPQLKKQLRILEEMQEASNDMESKGLNIKIVLNGILIKDKTPVALINNKTYQEGDGIGNFIITKISINKAALPYIVVKDKNTNQAETLYLYLAPQ